MFFVLSGFLIVSRLLREQATTGTISLRGFYRRRVRRIFPLYYAVLLASAAWTVLSPYSVSGKEFRTAIPWSWFYLSNWVAVPGILAVTWSLACEEQFYLAWPLIQRYLSRRRAFTVLVVLLVLNSAVQVGTLDDPLHRLGLDPDALNVLQVTFTPILLGVLLAYLLHNPRSFAALRAGLVRSRVPATISIACLILASLPISETRGPARLVLHLGMTALLASVVLSETGRTSRFFQHRTLVSIGSLSYGMYLLHMFARYGVDKVLRRLHAESGLLLFILVTLTTIAGAAASARYIESRFRS